jgi:dethiobiotin synthetase
VKKKLFVTGTDTGVGKTMVSCALLAAFSRRGLTVAAMKPCETGDGDDAERLIAASGRPLPFSEVSPFRFPLPASPEVAARAAGGRVELSTIERCYRALFSDADFMLVEGAGGLLVPLGPDGDMADLARALELPLLVVARPSLGTVNHTLLTLEAGRRRGLAIAGVIFSRTQPPAGPDEPTNPEAIATHGRTEIFGTLPRLESSDPAALAEAAEEHLALDRLLERL